MTAVMTGQDGYVFRDRYPERVETYARYDQQSALARALPCFVGGLSYGTHERERYDLFLANERDAPLVVFFHGGYWQSLDRHRFSFIGAALVRKGFCVALPSYPLCPEISLEGLLSNAARSLPAIFQKLREQGRHPKSWTISGHSAGGHIATWLATAALPHSVARPAACLPISGIFNLAPLCATTLNAAIGMSPDQATRFSPPAPPAEGPQMKIVVGVAETEAFINQSIDYHQRTTGAGGCSQLIYLPDLNHYTILGDFLEESSGILPLFNNPK